MMCLFVWIDGEYLTDAVVMVPLLKKLLLISSWVSLYEILQLRQVGCEENTATHDEET